MKYKDILSAEKKTGPQWTIFSLFKCQNKLVPKLFDNSIKNELNIMKLYTKTKQDHINDMIFKYFEFLSHTIILIIPNTGNINKK